MTFIGTPYGRLRVAICHMNSPTLMSISTLVYLRHAVFSLLNAWEQQICSQASSPKAASPDVNHFRNLMELRYPLSSYTLQTFEFSVSYCYVYLVTVTGVAGDRKVLTTSASIHLSFLENRAKEISTRA
jgi:hypothetical protein